VQSIDAHLGHTETPKNRYVVVDETNDYYYDYYYHHRSTSYHCRVSYLFLYLSENH